MITDAQIAAFWKRFSKLEAKLRKQIDNVTAGKSHDKLIRFLDESVGDLHDDVKLETGRHRDGHYELILSADGIRQSIPAVIALASAAPQFDHWRVIAFRPRKDASGMTLQMGFADLTVEDLAFAPFRSDADEDDSDEEGPLNILILAEKLDGMEEEQVYHIVFLLLDVVVGEYDVMTKLGEIQCATQLPDDPPGIREALRPITELPSLIDSLPGASIH